MICSKTSSLKSPCILHRLAAKNIIYTVTLLIFCVFSLDHFWVPDRFPPQSQDRASRHRQQPPSPGLPLGVGQPAKASLHGAERGLHLGLTVRYAGERHLELAGREVDALFQHEMEETSRSARVSAWSLADAASSIRVPASLRKYKPKIGAGLPGLDRDPRIACYPVDTGRQFPGGRLDSREKCPAREGS